MDNKLVDEEDTGEKQDAPNISPKIELIVLPEGCLTNVLSYLPLHHVVACARLVNKRIKSFADVVIGIGMKLSSRGVKGRKLETKCKNATLFKHRNGRVKKGIEKAKAMAMARAKTNPPRNKLIETQQLPLNSNHLQIRNIRAMINTSNLNQRYQVVATNRLNSSETVVGLDLSDSPLKARVKISVYLEELAQMRRRRSLAIDRFDPTTTRRLIDKTSDCLPSLEAIVNQGREWALVTFLPNISSSGRGEGGAPTSHYDQFVAGTKQSLSAHPLKTYGTGTTRDNIGVDLKGMCVFLRVNKLALPDIYRKGSAEVDNHTKKQMKALRNL